jgi:hypothetical protein
MGSQDVIQRGPGEQGSKLLSFAGNVEESGSGVVRQEFLGIAGVDQIVKRQRRHRSVLRETEGQVKIGGKSRRKKTRRPD